MSSSGTSRRNFIKGGAALAGAGVWVATRDVAFAAEQPKGANEKFNIACVGVGGKGGSDTDHAGKFGNIVALCDVDQVRLDDKGQLYEKAKRYTDYRKMFDEMGDKFDAVTVSTADHTHAPAAMRALRLGKHVYIQKPMTHTVFEARALRDAAKEKKVATQMGNQGTASPGLRKGVEVIRSGAIGPVKEVHVWTNRPVWPQAPGIMQRSADMPPVPPTLNWDAWLGPAPERPYHPDYHPFKWRGWWDFGTGALGDMACHTANLPFMALNLKYPTSVVGECGDLNPETFPRWAHVIWQFPEREGMPALDFHWYEGQMLARKLLPPLELFHGQQPSDSGSLMVGEKGVMYSPSDYGSDWKLLPEKDFAGYQPPSESLPRNPTGDDEGMKWEWLEAAKAGKPEIALSNFDYAGVLTETVLMGNIAIRLPGQKLEWDGEMAKFKNSEAANKFVSKEYRKGWEL
jgi:predicted dehydrogenase